MREKRSPSIAFTPATDCPDCDNPLNILITDMDRGTYTLKCGTHGHDHPARITTDPADDDAIRFHFEVIEHSAK